MIRPTHTDAINYVTTLFAGPVWEGMENIRIVSTKDNDEDADAAVDVTFMYDASDADIIGTMTVWTESTGKLYGEW